MKMKGEDRSASTLCWRHPSYGTEHHPGGANAGRLLSHMWRCWTVAGSWETVSREIGDSDVPLMLRETNSALAMKTTSPTTVSWRAGQEKTNGLGSFQERWGSSDEDEGRPALCSQLFHSAVLPEPLVICTSANWAQRQWKEPAQEDH